MRISRRMMVRFPNSGLPSHRSGKGSLPSSGCFSSPFQIWHGQCFVCLVAASGSRPRSDKEEDQ
jgi:hypothetical protein